MSAIVATIRATDRLVLVKGWVCLRVDECTCGSGQPPHQDDCGYEPVAPIDTRRHDTVTSLDRRPEYIVQVGRSRMDQLREWLKRPNGSLWVNDRLTIEAVEDGGIVVRSQPYRSRKREGRS